MENTEVSDEITLESLTQAKEILEKENADLKDKWLRALAEVENTRRKHKKDLEEVQFTQLNGFLKNILPTYDALEKAVEHAADLNKVKMTVEGIRLAHSQLESSLKKMGLVRVKTTGLTFDPKVHEVLLHDESTDGPENQIIAEYCSGWTHGDKLIRPAMVSLPKKS